MKKLTRNQVLIVINEIKELNNELISAQDLKDSQRAETVGRIVADIDILTDFIVYGYNDVLTFEETYEIYKKKIKKRKFKIGDKVLFDNFKCIITALFIDTETGIEYAEVKPEFNLEIFGIEVELSRLIEAK